MPVLLLLRNAVNSEGKFELYIELNYTLMSLNVLFLASETELSQLQKTPDREM